MNPLISVIVPVYKVEPYLRRCVDSIIKQTYTNLEIILVDDGSPDMCGMICDEIAEKDDRIKVIHKKNGGLSDARNAGIEIATGEWLSFIDSDDWIEPTMYEKLIHNANKHSAQISIGGVFDEAMTIDGIVVIKTTADKGNSIEIRNKVNAIEHFLSNAWSAWDKIYRREIFEGVRYPVGEINEDEAIALYLLEKCERVVYTNEPFYHYIRRPESITTTAFNPKKLIWAKHCRDNLAWISEHYPELLPYARSRYCGCLVWLLSELSQANSELRQSSKELLKELKAEYPNFKKLSSLSNNTRTHMTLQKYLPFGMYSLLLKTWRRLRHG
ncbi:MAG: glycosyltransferase family 2 protein [Clostridia bacterium]|nr:glycosyltransferase family 2 protein [Clostridia bacterium]